jgi:hypothetical protein
MSKQAHLSSFALREDAELGRGGLQVAARADLCPSGHTCTAPSGLSTSLHGIQTSASGEACSGRFRLRRPAGLLFLIHNASCLNLQSNVAGSLCIGAGTFRSIRGSPEEAVRWRRRFQGTKQLVFLPFTIIIFGPHIFLISFCVFTLAPFGTALVQTKRIRVSYMQGLWSEWYESGLSVGCLGCSGTSDHNLGCLTLKGSLEHLHVDSMWFCMSWSLCPGRRIVARSWIWFLRT